jgi:hypothetical protein
MPYMLMIVEPRGQRLERSLEEGQAAYASMQQYAEQLQQAGVLQGFDSLQPDDRGVRLQVRNGQARTLDGPFSEAKEMIGGYFLIDCASQAEAVAWAARCPAAAWATVEVRGVGPCYE